MTGELHGFKRLVLGLQPGVNERPIQLAVEIADLLQLELLGLFLDDTSLRNLAGIPFSRELRLPGGGWRAIELDRLSHDLELAARGTERKFAGAAKRLSTGFQFEVAQGSIARTLASVSRTDDIIMIVEPSSPAERFTLQFSWLLEVAFQSAAAVLLVPSRIARTGGPVVALATRSNDPGILAAAAIAVAAKEELVIVETGGHGIEDPNIQRFAADTGLSVRRVAAAGLKPVDPTACALAFGSIQERLIVMTRGSFADEATSTIAAGRRVPVLVVEPLGRRRPGSGDDSPS